jgi:hypothetical protein
MDSLDGSSICAVISTDALCGHSDQSDLDRLVRAVAGGYRPTRSPWISPAGQYSSVELDPSAPGNSCAVSAQEYAGATGWLTRLVRFGTC